MTPEARTLLARVTLWVQGILLLMVAGVVFTPSLVIDNPGVGGVVGRLLVLPAPVVLVLAAGAFVLAGTRLAVSEAPAAFGTCVIGFAIWATVTLGADGESPLLLDMPMVLVFILAPLATITVAGWPLIAGLRGGAEAPSPAPVGPLYKPPPPPSTYSPNAYEGELPPSRGVQEIGPTGGAPASGEDILGK